MARSEVVPGLTLHRVGGHTAGLQIVRVWTQRGWMVLAAMPRTCIPISSKTGPFPVVYSVAEMLEGYKTLYRLADSPNHIVPGHDPLVMKYYPAPTSPPRWHRGAAGCSAVRAKCRVIS